VFKQKLKSYLMLSA